MMPFLEFEGDAYAAADDDDNDNDVSFPALPLKPLRGVVKILTGLWLLLALILITVYRSNLKAMLILPKVNLPFDSLEQLTLTEIPLWVSPNSVLHVAAMVMLSSW